MKPCPSARFGAVPSGWGLGKVNRGSGPKSSPLNSNLFFFQRLKSAASRPTSFRGLAFAGGPAAARPQNGSVKPNPILPQKMIIGRLPHTMLNPGLVSV